MSQVIIGLQVFSPSTFSIKMYDDREYEYPASAVAIGKKYDCLSPVGAVGIHTTFCRVFLQSPGWCIAFSSVLLIPVMAVRAYVRAAEQTGPGGSFKTVSNYRNLQLDVQV